MGETFLTPMQIRILELRARGYTQAAIARELGSSRANISITEKRARENIRKSRATLEVFKKIGAPMVVEIGRGEDIFNVPREIFSCATECEIKVRENTLSVIDKIKERVPHKVSGRVIKEDIKVTILQDGGLIIE